MSSPASALPACAACGASSPLVCASCLKTRFCSPACAAAAWAGHRAACAEFSVLAELPDNALEPIPPSAPMPLLPPPPPPRCASPLASLPLAAWAARQRTLLAAEREAALEAALARLQRGAAAAGAASGGAPPRAPRLVVEKISAGLFGRTLVSLVAGGGGGAALLPASLADLTPGDVVGLRGASGSGGAGAGAGSSLRDAYDATGVITRAAPGGLELALDEAAGDGGAGVDVGDRVRVDKLADDVTFTRLAAALDGALAAGKSGGAAPASRLLSLLFPGDDGAPSPAAGLAAV